MESIQAIHGNFPMSSMREACAPVMETLGEKHPQLMTMGTDGKSIFGAFAQRFPSRYVDVGVAEANLMGVAAGLALAGKVVFVGGIASFLLRRGYEQLRHDICSPGLPVKVIGVGGGLSYGTLGSTHHLTEDIALTRVLPNMAIFLPADSREAAAALEAALNWHGPAYVRLGTGMEPLLPQGLTPSQVGQPTLLRDGRDLLILATGFCVSQACIAAENLESLGYAIAVASVHTLKPMDRDALLRLVKTVDRPVLVVEEHSCSGGLGNMVVELIGGQLNRSIRCAGIPDVHLPVGTRDELLAQLGLDHSGITDRALAILRPSS